ncbi:hypothetical protein HRbin23_01612 [bacterium HR23]|nr:hypothetical protein HRbin23_01612 [bacterium HR23]
MTGPVGVNGAVYIWGEGAGAPFGVQGVIGVVGVLAAPKTAQVGAVKARVDIRNDALSGFPIGSGTGHHPRPQEKAQEGRLVVGHLLVVGFGPVPLGGVAEEPPFHPIPDGPIAHAVQRFDDHAQEEGFTELGIEVQQEVVGIGVREFRLDAQPAEEGVKLGRYRPCHRVHYLGREGRAHSDPAHPLQTAVAYLLGAAVDRRLLLAVEVCHPRQGLLELMGRDVGAPGDEVPLGGKEGGGRPAPHVVALVHLRVLIVVYPNRDVEGIDKANGLRVGVGGLVHHMAPVAPDGGDGEQNWLVLPLGLQEGALSPGAPLDFVGTVGPWREAKGRHSTLPEILPIPRLTQGMGGGNAGAGDALLAPERPPRGC